MSGLTVRQQQVLEFVRGYVSASGYVPSFEEIKQGCDLANKSAVRHIVGALVKRGHIRREPPLARSIEIIDHRACPHCGRRP